MRNKKEVLNEVVEFAKRNKVIDVLLITGSMVNPNAETDIFSDLDVVIITNSPLTFVRDKSWSNKFGEVMVSFNDKFKLEGITTYTSLNLYKDYIRIDFSIWPIKLIDKISNQKKLPEFLDVGYKVLYDKKGITKKMSTPTHKAYQSEKPTEEEYNKVVNNFWWDITYIAKYLWRDQLYFAKYMDYFIKFNLMQPMIEWLIGVDNNWKINPGKHGSEFKKYLDEKIWRELEGTFSGVDIEENWNSMFKMMNLFSKISKKVAYRLRFEYPQKLEDDVKKYLRKIKSQEIPFEK